MELIEKIFFLVKVVFFYIATFVLGMIIPKKKDLVVITASKGKYYNGNAKALFEYLQTREDVEGYYFVSEKELFHTLSRERGNIIYHYSWRGLWLFLRARTVCITHGHADFLGFFPSLWQNWIYLGHGTGTKALGYLKEKLTLEEKVMLLLSRHLFYIVRSDFTRYMFAARYHVKPERVFITGHPRIDILHKGRKSDDESRFENVLYAPTYREGGITEIFPFDDFDTSRLRSLQESLDFNLNVRFHPNNYKESKEAVEDLFTSSSRIRYMDPKLFPDVQDVLLETDILITDFSSISRDFLFLDRSMIFIMNGLKDLGNLVLPIREEFAFCGYKVRTYEEFEEAVKEILEGKDKYAQVRRFVRDLMYNHIDDKSSERVAELIKELA